MKLDTQKVWVSARQASTEDLLDRITAFRQGMEPEALAIFEAELSDRGITWEAIEAHARAQADVCIHSADGTALACSLCRKPAVIEKWGWHRLWKVLPVFPRIFRYCRDHAQNDTATT